MQQQSLLSNRGLLQPSRREVLRLLGLATVGLVGGCVGFDEPGFTIEMTNRNQFSPASLEIPIGSRVAWKNMDTDIHTATFNTDLLYELSGIELPNSALSWDSGNLYNGQIWSHLFDAAGDYVYFCRYHAASGMVGTIRVLDS